MTSDDREVQRERVLDRRADELAAELLEVCAELGWGSGEPLHDAEHRLHTAALRTGRVPMRKPQRRKDVNRSVIRSVWDRDGWACIRCGSHQNLTVDHRVPVSLGGSNDPENLQTMCGSCNSSKGARLEEAG